MGYLDKAGLTRLWTHIVAKLGEKVDKVEGKDLSTNDFTTAEKTKLANVSTATEVATQIDNTINALSIGGTNLFRNTQHPASSPWLNLNYWSYDSTYQNCTVYRRDDVWNGFSQQITLEAGKQYTFSAWIKQTDGGSVLYYDNYDSTGQPVSNRNGTILSVGTDWGRYSLTLTPLTTGVYFPRFEQTVADNSIWIAGIKLEEGEKATSWSPSPFDNENLGEGINLFKGTHDFSYGNWNNLTAWTNDGTFRGLPVMKCTSSWTALKQNVTLEIGQEYTMSAWMKQESGGVIWFYSKTDSTSNTTVDTIKLSQVGTDWTHASVTFTALTTDGSELGFNEDVAGKAMWMAGLKLERGGTATAWTASPEDPALVSQSNCAVTATSTDGVSYTATVPGITELAAGASFVIVPNMTNTSINLKLNVNNLGAKNIRMNYFNQKGSNGYYLASGSFVANIPYHIMYTGTVWKLIDYGLYNISDLAIEKGGTGATTASGARTNLGITSGTTLPNTANEGDIFFLYTTTT